MMTKGVVFKVSIVAPYVVHIVFWPCVHISHIIYLHKYSHLIAVFGVDK
jgi:hypothetical protein